jgi:hypothetical protein
MNDKRATKTSVEPTKPPAKTINDIVVRYQKTGRYSAGDIAKVLGDPVKGVPLSAQPGLEVAYKKR